jgi:DNA-binding NtrC family response regulator
MTDVKILLVDDEEAFVATMAKRLVRRNVATAVAHNGRAALEKLEENPEIEVVILDVKMPGMNGIETLREIKKAFPATEVILLTGHATFESAMDGMKLGAFDYLMKPCDVEELLAKADEAAARRRRYRDQRQAALGRELSRRPES